MLRFDKQRLIEKRDRVNPLLRAIFAAAAAERVSRAYIRYAHLTRRGNSAAFGESLSQLWSDIEGQRQRMTSAELKETRELVLTLIPRGSDSPWVSEQACAEAAAAALAYALWCRENGHSAEAAWAARRAYEAMDHFAIAKNAVDTSRPGANKEVQSSSLVQAELLHQRRDLDELLADDAKPQDIKTTAQRMRQRAYTKSRTIWESLQGTTP
jgi:Protein of unknown function (DUF416)